MFFFDSALAPHAEGGGFQQLCGSCPLLQHQIRKELLMEGKDGEFDGEIWEADKNAPPFLACKSRG
jgi:hypothetical protein